MMDFLKNIVNTSRILIIVLMLVHGILTTPPNERYDVEPETIISTELLDEQSRPAISFTMNFEMVKMTIGIWNYTKYKDNNDYRLSLVVESMSCDPKNNIFLRITGDRNTRIELCHNVNNSENDFQSVKEVYDEEESFTIELLIGNKRDWALIKEPQVKLVASIYHEVPGDCGKCPTNTFCCDETKHNCFSTRSNHDPYSSVSYKSRCIPKYMSRTGSAPLCDMHPNCGRYCNADESDDICDTKKREKQNIINDSKNIRKCYGYDCEAGETGMTVTLIVVGILVLISIVYAVAMMSPFVRKYFGIPQNMRQNSSEQNETNRTPNREMDSHSIGSVFVYVNTMSINSISRQINDLPPPYEELGTVTNIPKQQHVFPDSSYHEDCDELPTFSEAVNSMNNECSEIESNIAHGIVNESYINNDNDG